MGFDPLSIYIVSETSANAVTRVTSLVKTSAHCRCCKVYIGQTHSAFETEFAFCQNHRLLQQSPRYQEPAQHLGCSMLQPFHGNRPFHAHTGRTTHCSTHQHVAMAKDYPSLLTIICISMGGLIVPATNAPRHHQCFPVARGQSFGQR